MSPKKKVKPLPPALLRLEAFWIESLEVKAERDWQAPEGSVEMALVGDTEYALAAEGGKVLIRLSFQSERQDANLLPYRFQATVAGRFSLAEDVPEDQRERMVYINGPAILYGVARGAVATVTALGRYGPVHLPTVNFLHLLEREPARRKAAKAKGGKRATTRRAAKTSRKVAGAKA